MEFYGILGTAYKLIKSYLQNRYQRVVVNVDSSKYYSGWEFVTVGVPQGSILGPLLFLLCVNDMPNIISDISNPVLYADDTSLIILNSDIQIFERDINTAIQKLNRWFHNNLLLLNLEKNYFLQSLTKNTNPADLKIISRNKQMAIANTVKFLGLTIDKTYHGMPTLNN
jgi:hypothetical protein